MAGVLALVAAGAMACTNDTTGSPTAASTGQTQPGTSSSRMPLPSFPGGGSSSTGSPSGGQGGPLASTDPCTLSAQAAAQADAGTGTPQNTGDGRQCRYQANGITLEVTIFDTQGLNDVVSSGQPKKIQIGGHEALQGQEPPSLCVINIGTSATSRVDLVAGARGDQSKACQVAEQVATALEPSLPR